MSKQVDPPKQPEPEPPTEVAFGVRKTADGASEMVEYQIAGDKVKRREIHAHDIATVCIERFKVRAAQFFRSITFRTFS